MLQEREAKLLGRNIILPPESSKVITGIRATDGHSGFQAQNMVNPYY